jgi:hypothetical protein
MVAGVVPKSSQGEERDLVDAPPPAAPLPPQRGRRSNWGLRLVALLLSVLAFLGFWQGTQQASATQPGGKDYAPPASGQGGLLGPGGLNPHGNTRLS